MAAKTVTIPLTLIKNTKGTYVYANDAKGITGLYFPKALFPGAGPETIQMTLSFEAATGTTEPEM